MRLSWCFVEAKSLDITKDQFAPDISAFINIIGKLGPLAQLVEQETLNLLVRGSSPRGPTNLPSKSNRDADFAAILPAREMAWTLYPDVREWRNW
jgi:hypothetical protein